MRDYSQYGESTIINEIFKKIGTINNFVVEFGASDGFWLSNARMFIEMGWGSLQMDGLKTPINDVKSEFITAENINDIFEKYNVPSNFDLLSIDIDGNDYWVWKNLNYNPNVVIIEYNSNFDLTESYVLKYNPKHIFSTENGYYSASLKALVKLGAEKGYFLHKEVAHTNLIFVKKDLKNYIEECDYNNIDLPKHNHSGKNLSKFDEI